MGRCVIKEFYKFKKRFFVRSFSGKKIVKYELVRDKI